MESDRNEHPSVGASYETDQRAIKVFRSWLPDSWLPREQSPDFFVDFLVEIVEAGEPTGLHFGAQIKGTSSGENLSYGFKSKHLRYYANRCQHPVFLFLIDVSTGNGWWTFAQKLIRERISSDSLRRQKRITVKFNTADCLSDFHRFKGVLPDAEKYVRDLHPGSVQAAMQKRKAELEAKDPRVSVSITAQDGKQHISVHPKETFSFTTKIRSRDPALREAWRSFVERGSELKLKPGDFEIVVAPLLGDLTKSPSGELTVQLCTPMPACVQILVGDVAQPDVLQIDGQIRGGTKYAMFCGAIPESPLSMTTELAFDPVNREAAQNSNLEFSMRNWTGQHVLLLSHFDLIHSLVSALTKAEAPVARFMVRGNRLWAGRFTGFDAAGLKDIVGMMEWLKQCRWLAQRFQLNPQLPPLEKLSDEQWESIEDAYGLLTNKKIVARAPGLSISCTVSNAPPESMLGRGDGILRLDKSEEIFDLLGHQIRVGPIRYLFSDMAVASRTAVAGGSTAFVFKGTQHTERTVELVSG